VLHPRHWSLANRRPDAAQQRFQANPMFVRRPQLNVRVGKGGGDLAQQGP
jgi:hypothetical protein